MDKLPTLKVRGTDKPVAIVQGGMGAYVSGAPLAGAVAQFGGVGIISTVALDLMVSERLGREVGSREAAKLEVIEARRLSNGNGCLGVNVMYHMHTCEESIRGAVDAGVDWIFAGAGLPTNLPKYVGDSSVRIAPIVSSARALKIICQQWQRLGRIPDAAVLEGPKAGGHLGFSPEQINNLEYSLENLFPPILEIAKEYNFPVIVAGGIWDREDVVHWIEAGAAGVQLGTRFLVTQESGASVDFKQHILDASPDDIVVAANPETPGSPAGMPFRVLKTSPGWEKASQWEQTMRCDLCYMLRKGEVGNCPALTGNESFCICQGLYNAVGPDPLGLSLYTVGANASQAKERGILSVKELIEELTGYTLRSRSYRSV